MATATQPVSDNRIHSTVYHKRDARINNIIRRCKKSEIISLYNINALMLFRVDSAHIQFDMLENHRPFILFHGKAEGVYLPASTGLLFPNACDQLDFRQDYTVDSSVTYALSDVELATLAGNGLFNYDWACQGRVIGSLLEIPCVVDYFAIAGTPITYIEIQNRLSLQTSTRKTGYKTLVSTFLPYAAQRHNLEEMPERKTMGEYNRDNSEIRKRAQFDSKTIGFNTEPVQRTLKDGASFVEVAQSRIQDRLQKQMNDSNILGLQADETSKNIADAVNLIKQQVTKTKDQTIFNAENNIARIDAATLDARLDDMKNRMVYAGAQSIPVETASIDAKSLVEKKPEDINDERMVSPLTKTTTDADTIAEKNKNIQDAQKQQEIQNVNKSETGGESDKQERVQEAIDQIEKSDKSIHEKIFDADQVSNDVTKKVMTRKEKLFQRRQQMLKNQQTMIEAGEAEAAKGMNKRKEDIAILDATTASKTKSTVTDLNAKAKSRGSMSDDILSNDIDIDDIVNMLGS